MMNFLLTCDRRNAQQKESTRICRYCKKVFDSYQALGGHLRSHQNMARKFPYLQSHSDSIHDTHPYFNPLSYYRASRENHRGNETESILSSHLSVASMPTALMDNVKRGGSTGSCKFDVESVRRFKNRYPYMSQNFLEAMKDHNYSNHPRSCGICSLCPCYLMNNMLEQMDYAPRITKLDTNKFLGTENPVLAGLLPPPPLHGQLTVSMCPKEYIRALTCGRENKRCLCRDLADEVMMMRAPKRPRVSSSSQVEKPPQNELLLFKDSNNYSSGSEIPTGGEEKCEANLDLSLHL